ncbi:Glycosyl transferases group 1 [Pseudovibrio denitrificans]|uniref:Glycosyl transferases group 1 n=1 Tax=Pseudovibrio denitrificans TaxID=258256 RepID=A0A1I7CTY5_9HYPH|nr:glycosyltransferase family 4 protein [Pseudovibrio denitrificans]SFU02878.1 Glycosyl transferases group 1 [Pseudovibrio denitrificans]
MKSKIFELVAISDRYPPNNFGGAEISLHTLMKTIASEGKNITVVSLMGEGHNLNYYSHEGVQVIEIPAQAPWPFHKFTLSRFKRISAVPFVFKLVRGLLAIRHIYKFRKINLLDRIKLLWLYRSGKIKGGLSIDQQVMIEGFSAKALRKLFLGSEIQILYLDNFRAICTASRLSSDALALMIRDHRFNCAKYDQSCCVSKVECELCDLACAEVDFKSRAKLMKKVLRFNTEFRADCLKKRGTPIVTSQYLKEKVSKHHNLKHIKKVPNVATVPKGQMLDIENDTGSFRVLNVGMINENKGQFDLIAELSEKIAEHDDIKIQFAGRGDRLERQIRQIAKQNGIQNQIEFLGFLSREEIFRAYARADVVISTAIWPEPFGRVPLEAGLMKKPMVAFAVGGLCESIVDGETGFLVPPTDFNAFWDRVLTLKYNKDMRREFGENAMRFISSNYNLKVSSQLLYDILYGDASETKEKSRELQFTVN